RKRSIIRRLRDSGRRLSPGDFPLRRCAAEIPHQNSGSTKSRNERKQMKVFRTLAIALLTILASSGIASSQEPFTAGTWTAVTNPAPSNVAHMLLLTDGSVLVYSFFFSNHADPWYRLIPDST